MITATCYCEKVGEVDLEAFEKSVKDVPVDHPLYDEVFVVFVTYDDGVGDHCFLEERCLYLILHCEANKVLEAFERNYELETVWYFRTKEMV